MPSTAQRQNVLRVLVVDDDADNAESTACLLGIWGHEARVAQDGKTALAEIEVQCPDLVLLDMGLPGGMDGWQVTTSVRQSVGPKPFIVAITGHGGEEARLRSQK